MPIHADSYTSVSQCLVLWFMFNVFSILCLFLQDAERSREIKEKAAAKHIEAFSFQPDIGSAKFRPVERDPEQFVQRLYDYRLKQQENTAKLTHEIHSLAEPTRKVLNPKDVDTLLER